MGVSIQKVKKWGCSVAAGQPAQLSKSNTDKAACSAPVCTWILERVHFSPREHFWLLEIENDMVTSSLPYIHQWLGLVASAEPTCALPVVLDWEEKKAEATRSFCFVLNNLRVWAASALPNSCLLGRNAVPVEVKSEAGGRCPSGWIWFTRTQTAAVLLCYGISSGLSRNPALASC